MFVITDDCTVIQEVDQYRTLSVLNKYHSYNIAKLLYEIFEKHTKLIFFPISYYYIPDVNIIKIKFNIKTDLLKELEKYQNDYYYLLELNRESVEYVAEIIHHSEVPVTGQALQFIRSAVIDELLKDL